jgi:hypothetical protein
MEKLDGTHLALGVVAAVAAAGAVASRSRGSRALSSMTADASLDPSLPWKAMVGAARGGPSLEKWKSSLRNYPFDIDLHVIDENGRDDISLWLRKMHRPAPGTLKLVVGAQEEETWDDQIRRDRKTAPSYSLALFTPFATLHRVFDASYGFAYKERRALALTGTVHEVVSAANRGESPHRVPEPKELRAWAWSDCEGHSDMDGCINKIVDKFRNARSVYERSKSTLEIGAVFIDDEVEGLRQAFNPYTELDEEWSRVFTRIVSSLICPTAAGRLLRLSDYSQAMADCYATWGISRRNPLVKLTEDDLYHFRVDKQVERWLATIGGAENTTDVAIRRYRENLERMAVPVLRWVAENDDEGSIDEVVYRGGLFHEQREPLINACNDVLSIQRVLAI